MFSKLLGKLCSVCQKTDRMGNSEVEFDIYDMILHLCVVLTQ
jgi:hypothetical protein